MAVLDERDVAHASKKTCDWRAEDLQKSVEFRKNYESAMNVVSAEDQPFENTPDGLIKHLVHEKMNTREHCIDAHMLFIKEGSHSGKSRQMSEELIFVAEGSGYDLHWDVKFDCDIAYSWEWEAEPKRNEWKRGDFIYIPPFTIQQHFNTGKGEARLIKITNRIVKSMGFNWVDQLENAPGF